jgi:hypothetical protein
MAPLGRGDFDELPRLDLRLLDRPPLLDTRDI